MRFVGVKFGFWGLVRVKWSGFICKSDQGFRELIGFHFRVQNDRENLGKRFTENVSIWFFECLSELEMAGEVECVRVLKFVGVLGVISRFFCLKGQVLVRFRFEVQSLKAAGIFRQVGVRLGRWFEWLGFEAA